MRAMRADISCHNEPGRSVTIKVPGTVVPTWDRIVSNGP
jgi:hypothetical protein